MSHHIQVSETGSPASAAALTRSCSSQFACRSPETWIRTLRMVSHVAGKLCAFEELDCLFRPSSR